MSRRFQAEIDRLDLLATTAAWRIAIVEVHDLLAELDAALRDASRGAAPGGAEFTLRLTEMRHALDRNLYTLEAAMAEALAKLAVLDTP